MDNPLDRLGLSPLATVEEITAALRERAEDASDEERKMLRATWEELTLHPRSRVRAAVLTFPPRTNAGDPRAPAFSAELRVVPPSADAHPHGVAPVDLMPRPAVARALGENGRVPPLPPALPPLEDDPILGRSSGS
jgi:hypothetical protein